MEESSLDTEYINRIKTNDSLLAAESQVVASSGEGTLEDPATSLRVVGGKDEPGEGGKVQAPEGGSADEAPKKPARFTITDPRINQGVPTGFDRIEDAVAIAGADQPLEKIEESIESQFMATLQTAQQKDAAQNLVDLLNIPVDHLAGLITKGDLSQTATPEELGETLLGGFDLEDMDEKKRMLLTTAAGIVAMAVIDPMNPALAGGKLAKAMKILKDERGSIPLGAGGGKQPPGGKPPAPAAAGDDQVPQQGFKRSKSAEEEERIWESVRDSFDGFQAQVTKQRRGPVLHDEDLIKLEKDSDLTMNAALNLPPGTALPPEQLLRVRNLLKRQFGAMKKAQKAYAKSGDIEDFKAMLRAMGHTKGLLKVLLGVYAEPARDVRIMAGHLPTKGKVKAEAGEQLLDSPDEFEKFKEREFRIADEWINHLYDFFVEMEKAAKRPNMPGPAARIPGAVMKEMGEAVDMLKTEEELAVFLKPLGNPVFWDVWKEHFYNAMLTGLAPVKNLVGTPMILGFEISQRSIQAGIDAIGTGLVRTLSNPDAQRSVYFGETAEMLDMAANKEAFLAGIRLGWESFKQGRPLVDPSHAEHSFPDISDTTLWLYQTGPMAWATSWMSNAMRRFMNKGIDFGSTVGGRMLLGGDTFNKFIAHQMQLRALALRKAYQQVEAEGLRGIEAEQRVQEIKRDVLTNSERYPELHDKARQFAQYVALQQELGKTGEMVANTMKQATIGPREAGFPSGFPAGTYMMPFTTIMFNAAKMAGEYTGPLALLSPSIRAELKAGGDRRNAAMGKIFFSSMLLDTLWSLASEGMITGNGPRGKEAKEAWMKATGKIPNAWWDPVTKQYRSASAFEPFSTVTSAVADINDMMSYLPPGEAEKGQYIMQSLAIAVANNVGIKQWTQGLMGTLNTAVSGDYDSYEQWFRRAIMTMVPYSGAQRQVTGGLDPELRSATNLIEEFYRQTPTLSDQLPHEINALGEIKLRRGGWWNAFSHGEPSQYQDVWDALVKHDIVIGEPPREIDGIKLTGKQYLDYAEAVADGLAEELRDQFVPEAADMTNEEARKMVGSIVARHRKLGRQQFLEDYGDVQEQIEALQERRADDERVKPSPFAPGRVQKEIFIGE